MEIKISNPDQIPWWLVFEMLEEVAYQYPDFSKVVPYKAQFGREGRVYTGQMRVTGQVFSKRRNHHLLQSPWTRMERKILHQPKRMENRIRCSTNRK